MSTPLSMTAGRRAALILGVPLALAVIAWAALTEVAYAGQGSYPVRLAVPVHGGTRPGRRTCASPRRWAASYG